MQDVCLEDQETIREFLIECHENLDRLDRDLVDLEQHPNDSSLLSSVFRTFHTIKGACGFLGFSNLERVTHQAETLLSQLRDGRRDLSPDLVSLILETVDATRNVLSAIEATGGEGDLHFEELTQRLRAAAELNIGTPNPARVEPAVVSESSATNPIKPLNEEMSPKVQSPNPVEPAKRIDERRSGEDRRQTPIPTSDEEECTRSPSAVDANIRVGVGLLDKLMDLVGELVLTRNQILQFNAQGEDPTLNATSQRLNLITSELQEGVMKTRMQPIGVVWQSLPRVVRDMAVSMGKQIQIRMEGEETELDRTIIEAIKDPLIHLVRNACDHGIEGPEVRLASGKPAQGTMSLRAYHEGGQVNIEIGDDGAGIDIARVKAKALEKGLLRPEQVDKLGDREALNLIFQAGFSTAQKVTRVSGRGVGMDVVKSNIEKIGGVVDLSSRPGEGTTVKIRIPLTLAIIPGLVVTSGGERFVIPQVSLLELIHLESDNSGKHIEYVHGAPVYRRRGTLLPVTYLDQVLGLKSAGETGTPSMVVLQAEDRQFGLVVDGINDTQEIVVKPLGKQLKGLTLYAGATIMGDGHVALILDVLGVGQHSGVFGESTQQTYAAEAAKRQDAEEQRRLLLFQAGSFERLAIPLALVARLEEFPQSAVEHAGGGQVVQYRSRILPLVSLRSVLEPNAPDCVEMADPLQVVVFNDGEQSFGMIVDQIVDIVEEAVTVRQKSVRPGLLGSAVVEKRVTDFLDLNVVIRTARDSWFPAVADSSRDRTILLADPSGFWRSLISTQLEMTKHRVLEASTLDQVLRQLETHSVNLLVAPLDLLQAGGELLASALGRHSGSGGASVLAVANTEAQAQRFDFQTAGFQACQARGDAVALLHAIVRLTDDPATPNNHEAAAGR
jgi:two-component system chemotaxis sensor kinase CheA